MFKIGDTVIVLRTYELLTVKGIETREGRVVYLCGREGTDESRSFTEEEIVDPFGRKV
jgi:hypothetical protein